MRVLASVTNKGARIVEGTKQVYEYDGFGDAIDFAASLGFDADKAEKDMLQSLCAAAEIPVCTWEELPAHLQCSTTDDIEEMALDYIREQGYFIEGIDEEQK